jgi:formylglycine-generating enzyme required for sulfatase activity
MPKKHDPRPAGLPRTCVLIILALELLVPSLATADPTTPPDGFVMVPAGTFIMGSPEDEPGRDTDERQHPVTLTRDFYLQATEVTQAQWQAVMGNPGSTVEQSSSYPVTDVSWWAALEYCNALSRAESLQECYALSGCNPAGAGTWTGIDRLVLW